MGGKGIGRFLWLVAFNHAEIESTFQDSRGTWMYRSFKLKASPDGVEDHVLKPAGEEHRRTIVRLVQVKDRYQKSLPKLPRVLANRIIEHCLQYFLLGLQSSLAVEDDDTNEKIDLGELYTSQVETFGKATALQVGNQSFQVNHLRVRPSYGEGHRLYFCADKRLVRSERLEGKIPNLDSSIKDSLGKPFVYSGYISGKFLDESVTPERTDFSMPDENSAFGDPTWAGLVGKISDEAKGYLEPFTAPLKREKEERIREYVRSKAPSFRPLVKHRPDILDSIPTNLSDEKLDIELYRYNQEYERTLREKGEQFVANIINIEGSFGVSSYDAFLEEWNESGVAKLANHIAHRKATLKMLRTSLGLTKEAKYSLEEAIHRLIFPLRKTSDDVPPDQMNLWIIDEKLAYHFYLASDIAFKSLQKDVLEVESSDRSDILIFNRPAAFVEQESPFSSIVILEFKRPVRDDYTDEENPINQVYRYIKQIRDGKARDRHGRPINVPTQIPCYAYIVADITQTLREQASFSGFQRNHDSSGFFTFNPELSTYVELLSFDSLIGNAERRNQFFFNQLNLPS